MTLRIPGGGGYGSPFERDPKRVLEDVKQERLSIEAARDAYGVAITADLEVDVEATAVLRQKIND